MSNNQLIMLLSMLEQANCELWRIEQLEDGASLAVLGGKGNEECLNHFLNGFASTFNMTVKNYRFAEDVITFQLRKVVW